MSFKMCRECGKAISRRAKACPACGVPIRRSGLGRLFRWTVALIVGFTIVGALAGKSGPRSAEATVTPPRQKPAPTAHRERPRGKWRSSYTTSPIDDKPVVTATLDAQSAIDAWPRKRTTPTLVIRWQEGQLACYFILGCAPDVENGTDGATLTLRFDDSPAVQVVGARSTDNEAIFLSQPEQIVRRMATSKRLLLRFVPFNSSPQTTTFDLAGTADAIEPIESAASMRLHP